MKYLKCFGLSLLPPKFIRDFYLSVTVKVVAFYFIILIYLILLTHFLLTNAPNGHGGANPNLGATYLGVYPRQTRRHQVRSRGLERVVAEELIKLLSVKNLSFQKCLMAKSGG